MTTFENQIIVGDALTTLRALPSGVAQVCVTSPPYYRVRDYGHPGQLGLEPTVEAYVSTLVEVLAEVRRVLTPDGTLWLNVADSYASQGTGGGDLGLLNTRAVARARAEVRSKPGQRKSLLLVPQRLAIALSDYGWIVRSEVVWHKPYPMPESVTDRPTKAHETILLLVKSPRYYYDREPIREPVSRNWSPKNAPTVNELGAHVLTSGQSKQRRMAYADPKGANCRDVWTIPSTPFHGDHFAVFPPELPRRCILASSRVGDLVLDPFAGSGTTCSVARFLARRYIGIELNPAYAELARARVAAGPQWSGKSPSIDDRQIVLFAKRET